MRSFFGKAAAALLLWLVPGGKALVADIIANLPPAQFDYAIQVFGQDEGVRYNTTTSFSGFLPGSSASIATSAVDDPQNDRGRRSSGERQINSIPRVQLWCFLF